MSKQVAIILTAAIVLNGEIQMAGTELTLPSADAHNLISRGRASLADGELLVDDEGQDDEAPAADPVEEETAEPKRKRQVGKKDK